MQVFFFIKSRKIKLSKQMFNSLLKTENFLKKKLLKRSKRKRLLKKAQKPAPLHPQPKKTKKLLNPSQKLL